MFSIDLTKTDNKHNQAVSSEYGNRKYRFQSPINADDSSTVDKNLISNHAGRSQLTPSRIRKIAIMVVIAGAFTITFFMALTFGYVFAVRDYGDFSSIRDLVVLFCCYRIYFLNYSLNPLVYFALDGKFRKEVKRLVACCRSD